MAHKTRPNSFRLGITKPWVSRWFWKKDNRYLLEEDCLIRQIIEKKILPAGIDAIEIERVGEQIKIIIRSARPGLIIGRGGKGIEELQKLLVKKITQARKANNLTTKFVLNINIEELKRFEVSARVIAQQAAADIEKRLPYRSVIKRTLEMIMQNKDVLGAKIKVSGRLNGAEISRSDWLADGKMPLNTLRANIDYGEATAFNTYGTVGVKVWIYKKNQKEE